MDDSFDPYFLLLAISWLSLQAVSLLRLHGRWRLAAWVPLIVMAVASATAVLGGLAGSNLAPIWVILALPVCLLWLLALWLVRAVAWTFTRSRP